MTSSNSAVKAVVSDTILSRPLLTSWHVYAHKHCGALTAVDAVKGPSGFEGICVFELNASARQVGGMPDAKQCAVQQGLYALEPKRRSEDWGWQRQV